jgi:hypothetical protein
VHWRALVVLARHLLSHTQMMHNDLMRQLTLGQAVDPCEEPPGV